ncbi:MAG: zinc ribbon domain-containing protein [Gaiellaceae bacterium]
MPIYEYRCPNGHVFELFHGINDPSPEGCEICGEGPVERVLHPVAVHFKGSGFYTTDYGRGARKRDADEPSKDGGKPADSGEKKKETKTEA